MNKIVAILSLCILCGCATQKPQYGVPNFAVVEKNVYRGGQPTAEGWKFLSGLGVTNVIKLNTGNDPVTNMVVHNFPITWWYQTFQAPNSNLVWTAVTNVTPYTYIHCTHGQDRTGLIVACYRHWIMAWSKEESGKEMMEKGFHPLLLGLYWFWTEEVK